MSMQRLRSDFQFAIITLFSVIAVLGVLPFAVFRFSNQQPLAGAIDLGIVACIVAGTAWAWRGGNVRTIALLVMCAVTLGCLAVTRVVGLSALLWMYPLLAGNFLMVDRNRAMAIALVSVSVQVLAGGVFPDHLQAFVFVATALTTSLFAYLFARRSEVQHRQLELLAAHDALTGAGNRRTMTRDLRASVESAAASGAPSGLVLLDLDHFKRINDRHGHEAGDRVLVEFARIVRDSLRGTDHFFRSGGEEFVVLATQTEAVGLQILAEHLRAAVAARLRCEGEPVTVSIGIAALQPGDTPASWMGRADAAMYRAKHLGRNRVAVDAEVDTTIAVA